MRYFHLQSIFAYLYRRPVLYSLASMIFSTVVSKIHSLTAI
ncbi:hypothetical protein CPK_ORF00357 [Chlamydia pneumoniae LPCoLN]|uniref:Uncharacterized protein n=1 Tax=Chlamydia pneumoniae TaxID=83558 RepID=Q9K1V5_CHLPN|nr:hypothetical protein [Chlamydia pneumoniae]AAF38701.1 hypothetical protein CP_0916 [Chlamydia pneumoniae AR39]ETR79723.1 hypothetical protein X556_0958 [Chlamydia pneumoniae B21]ACZ32834.1 hypothetical protein CPK_ORF00357 [Chlamydia pneumoniae LPCoLN]CRI33478.1 Uncharacterized protein BN1224_Wien1_A_09850 [Chlamydia pneumoniae]CRI36341.1 Uncharacterized protein BN1224_CM1_A_09880 [Chlamydia pneumoniae]